MFPIYWYCWHSIMTTEASLVVIVSPIVLPLHNIQPRVFHINFPGSPLQSVASSFAADQCTRWRLLKWIIAAVFGNKHYGVLYNYSYRAMQVSLAAPSQWEMALHCSGRSPVHALDVFVVFQHMLPLHSSTRNVKPFIHTVLNWYNFPTWWRHQMETFSALLAICARNSPASDAEIGCYLSSAPEYTVE